MKRTIRYLATLYLISLLALWGLIHFDTGNLWPVTLFLFSPRWSVALPLIVFVPLSLVFDYRSALAYLLHGLIILVPILGYRGAWRESVAGDEGSLRIMTYNLGGGSIGADELAALVIAREIDVLVLQECASSLSKPVFEKLGWAHRQRSNIAVGSALDLGELQTLATRLPKQYNGIAAVSCELRLPGGAPVANKDAGDPKEAKTVRIVDVHFPTFRPALEKARRFEWDAGAAIKDIGVQYDELVEPVRQQLAGSELPTIIAGDFNVPVESAFYRRYWRDYRNSLSSVGKGLRYTKHTRLHGIRIDHVLVDGRWRILSATVGPSLGGDHRPVIAELSLIK